MPKNSFQKGSVQISTFAGMAIIAAVVVVISTIAVIKYRETANVVAPVAVISPKLTSVANLDETADWKIYSNENWTIKFPLTYERISPEDEGIADIFAEKSFQGINIVDLPAQALDFSVFIFKKTETKPAGISFLKHIQSLAEKSKKYDDYFQTDIQLIENPEVIQLDSIIGVKTRLFTFEDCPRYAYWIEKNDTEYIEIDVAKCYEVGGPFGIEGLTFKQRLAIESELMQILSTFKFTERNEIVDWKTYRNEKYGFEFKFPAEQVISPPLKVYETLKNGISFSEFSNGCFIVIFKINRDSDFNPFDESGLDVKQRQYVFSKKFDLEYAFYHVGMAVVSHAVSPENCEPLFNQILSTFRFTK